MYKAERRARVVSGSISVPLGDRDCRNTVYSRRYPTRKQNQLKQNPINSQNLAQQGMFQVDPQRIAGCASIVMSVELQAATI